jgi:hypothetical protein
MSYSEMRTGEISVQTEIESPKVTYEPLRLDVDQGDRTSHHHGDENNLRPSTLTWEPNDPENPMN